VIKLDPTEWRNLQAIDVRALIEEVRPQMEPAMKGVLLILEGEIKRRLRGKRSGRMYRINARGRKPRFHQASAPGESPAQLYGNLRNSVGHEGPRWIGMYTIEGVVGPGLGQAPRGGQPDPAKAYARRLELGGVSTTPQGGVVRILPRPYMEPATQSALPKIDRFLRRELG